MAQLKCVLLLFALCFGFYICQDTDSIKFDRLASFVLNKFNDHLDSVYLYKSAKVIRGFTEGGSDPSHHLKLDFSVGCNSKLISEAECFPKSLICEVIVDEDETNGDLKLRDDKTDCSLPEAEQPDLESRNEPLDESPVDKQIEDANAFLDSLGPFLLKPSIPLPNKSSKPAVEEADMNVEDKPEQRTVGVDNEEIDVEEEPISVGQQAVDVDQEPLDNEQQPIDVEERMVPSEESLVNNPLAEVIEPVIVKKQAYCTGCVTDIDASIPVLQDLAEQARAMIDESSNSLYKHNVVKIAKAQKQVVSGIKYILTLEVVETCCLKSTGQESELCDPSLSISRMCVVEYIDKPWLKSRVIISNNCTTGDDDNNLENEIEPHFAHKPESDRQSIFDYLDSMEKPMNDVPQYDMEFVPQPDASESDGAMEVENQEKLTKVTEPEVRADKLGSSEEVSKDTDKSSEESVEDADSQPAMYKEPFVGGVFRKKREVQGGNRFGGFKDITDSEKQLVSDLAEIAVQTLDEIDADDSKRIVLEVLDAKKHLVDSSVMYSLKLRVGSTSCSENGALRPGCLKDQVASPKICLIQMHRSFADDSPNNVKVVKSECTNEPRGRHRRQLVGGYSPADVNDPYILEIANFAVLEVDKSNVSRFKQTLVKVVKAEKQVVAGTNIRLKLELGDSACLKDGENTAQCCDCTKNPPKRFCQIVVWDRPWLKSRQLTSSSCENQAPSRKKRSANLQGGVSEVDVNDPSILSLSKTSLAHIDAMTNSAYAQKVVKVMHATRQVVGGMRYVITFELGFTSCMKNKQNLGECNVKEDSNNQICVVELWDRPWLSRTKVLSSSCSAAPTAPSRTPSATPLESNKVKRSMIGGGTHDIHVGMFRDFMAEHGKVYATQEEMKRRFHIYRANMKKVETLQKTERGTGKYGATRFADLTSKEFAKLYLGLKPQLKKADHVVLPQANIPQITLPTEYDWRNYNVVTPVKNQGMCGSCWAFSVTGNVEGQWALRRGQLLSLSEQELVDCDKLDSGCEGGLPENAYKAITDIGGLETEKDYPYDGADEKCHFNKTEVKVTVTGGLNITTNETQMAQWLVKNGPISIGINANAMQFYMGGVSHPWKMLCDPSSLDHGVLIVGYGVHKTSIRHKILPYWIVKNSWGPHWGEKGYYRVYRGDGTCGVNQMATSAVVG